MNVYIKAKQISTNVRFQTTIHRWKFSEFSKLKIPYDTVLVADFSVIPIICLLYYFFLPATTIRTIPNTPISIMSVRMMLASDSVPSFFSKINIGTRRELEQ